jgi:murein DD-endopeptidase MepM/ murein hydrolase activator NlpD
MSDEFRKIHEELAAKYLEMHPGTDLGAAMDRTTLAAYDEYVERLAAQADEERMRQKQ